MGSKIPVIIESLKKVYGAPQKPEKNIPIVDQIVMTILEPDENPPKARAAYRALKTEFVDWNELRVTHPREIQELISKYISNHIFEKSHSLRDILSQIFNLCNTLNLQFLWEIDFSEIQKFFQQLHGLKEGTFYQILAQCYYQAEAHLSSSFIRTGKRIHIWDDIQTETNFKKTLLDIIGIDDLFHLEILLFQHGESVCIPKGYDCSQCCISKHCERGTKELAAKKKGKRGKHSFAMEDIEDDSELLAEEKLDESEAEVEKPKKRLSISIPKRRRPILKRQADDDDF